MSQDRIEDVLKDVKGAVLSKGGFVIPEYDSIYQTISGSSKIFEYKKNGDTVATITATYSDGSFTTLLNVVKS